MDGYAVYAVIGFKERIVSPIFTSVDEANKCREWMSGLPEILRPSSELHVALVDITDKFEPWYDDEFIDRFETKK